jgi:hypothetical protein
VRAAVACAGLCFVVTGASHAAEWLIAPSMRVATVYTDNPRLLEEGGTSSAGAIADLSARLQRRTERLDLELQPRWYSARARDDETLNTDDQYLDARINYLTERSQWSGSMGFARDTTLTSEAGSTGLIQSNRRHESITVSGGPTWMLTERVDFSMQGYVLDSHYVDPGNTGLVDYQYRLASLGGGVAATERSTVRLTLQGGELVVPDFDTRTRDGSARLAWEFKSGGLWTTTLSAGPAYVDAEFGHDTGPVFDVDAERRGERWTFGAHAGRGLTPTGRGVLTKRDRAVLSFNRQFTQNVSAGTTLQWIRNQNLQQQPGIAFDDVDYLRVDLNLNWRLGEHWSFALSMGGASQSYDNQNDADSYRASVGIVWNGQQRSL